MRKTIIAAVVAATAALAVQARESGIDSLARAIVLADPAWQARGASLRASALSVQSETSLPGPEAEGEYLWGPAGDNRWGAGISQSFDWPGVYAARRDAARAATGAFRLLAEAELAERCLAAKLALIDLVAARRRTATVAGIADNLRRLTELTSTALDRGQATILDLRKLQLASIETDMRLQQAEQTRTDALGALRAMGYTSDVPDGLSYPADTDTSGVLQAWAAMPSVMGARAEAEAAAARARAASRSMMPGFTLGYRHQFEGGHHFNGLSVGITLPSWASAKARNAARAEAEAARLQTDAEFSRLAADMHTSRRTLASLEARVKAYYRILDGSDYLELLRKSLDGGQISVLTYIQEVNFFLEAELARIDAEQQYQAALAGILRFNTCH